jgi:hypothetical protein
MNNNNPSRPLNFIAAGILLCFLFFSCSSISKEKSSESSQKNQKTFDHKPSYPLVAGCEGAQSSSCLENTISNLIVQEGIQRKMLFASDTLNIGICFKANGELYLIRNLTNNDQLRQLSVDVVNSIDVIAPGYSERENRYVLHTYIWFVIIKNNEFVNPSDY